MTQIEYVIIKTYKTCKGFSVKKTEFRSQESEFRIKRQPAKNFVTTQVQSSMILLKNVDII